MILVIYVDDILLTGSDAVNIVKAKEYLKTLFVTKDMGKPRHFLGIEITHIKHVVFPSMKICFAIYYKRLNF